MCLKNSGNWWPITEPMIHTASHIYCVYVSALIFSLISNFPLEQGIIPAVQYYKSCQELLGDNFNGVFNELLVLLPDTRKQQELLTAHGDFKQQQVSKPKKTKKKAWQTGTTSNGLELDCQVCPTCKQVLALKDFNTHKTLHTDDDFPSLQAISKIIS